MNITVIFDTHNIDKAFELGDRITIMNKGKIEQCDYPKNLIKNPKTSFILTFVHQGKSMKRIQMLKDIK